MKKKKLMGNFNVLFKYFDDPSEGSFGSVIEERILGFYKEEFEILDKHLSEIDELDEKFAHFYWGIMQTAFSYGFVIGRLLDPVWDEVREAEKVITEDVKKNKLVLYLPRERAA